MKLVVDAGYFGNGSLFVYSLAADIGRFSIEAPTLFPAVTWASGPIDPP
ncbi:MAG: hypothetical protein IPM35_33650 [Myxococcales bacterium]|nr:hypothetical protein [Myxococcales bacterium]